MSARAKITKADPDALELSVAQALFDLETSSAEMKADLRPLQFSAAKEVTLPGGRLAVVLFVPPPLLKQFHKAHAQIVRELEKKFSDRHVLLVAQRKIMPKPSRTQRNLKQQRPRSRTLTAVHEALLEDIVFPTEITGKRTRVKVDGSKLIKVYVTNLLNKHIIFVIFFILVVGNMMNSTAIKPSSFR